MFVSINYELFLCLIPFLSFLLFFFLFYYILSYIFVYICVCACVHDLRKFGVAGESREFIHSYLFVLEKSGMLSLSILSSCEHLSRTSSGWKKRLERRNNTRIALSHLARVCDRQKGVADVTVVSIWEGGGRVGIIHPMFPFSRYAFALSVSCPNRSISVPYREWAPRRPRQMWNLSPGAETAELNSINEYGHRAHLHAEKKRNMVSLINDSSMRSIDEMSLKGNGFRAE